MLSIFDKYVLKIVFASTWIVAISLTIIVLLTQSIRFLELVIGSDASSSYFLLLMGLAVPKFLEAVLPIAFAIGTIFTCYRLILDREMIIMYAAGLPALRLARPFIIFAGFMMIVQFVMSSYIAPLAVDNLQKVRSDVKSHYATLLFREGVFNEIGSGITAYVEQRIGLNELKNLMINDDSGQFNKGKATTIIARRGIVDSSDNGQTLLIFDGTQYQRDLGTNQISRLDFERYTLDIPVADQTIGTRWREPDERTLHELFISKNTTNPTDLKKRFEFLAEAHRRISTPFLYASYAAIISAFLLLGSWNRRQQSSHVIKAGAAVIVLQALHIVAYNESQDAIWFASALYILGIVPGLIGLIFLYQPRKLT